MRTVRQCSLLRAARELGWSGCCESVTRIRSLKGRYGGATICRLRDAKCPTGIAPGRLRQLRGSEICIPESRARFSGGSETLEEPFRRPRLHLLPRFIVSGVHQQAGSASRTWTNRRKRKGLGDGGKTMIAGCVGRKLRPILGVAIVLLAACGTWAGSGVGWPRAAGAWKHTPLYPKQATVEEGFC